MKKIILIALSLTLVLLLGACSSSQPQWQDGYYTAEASEYIHGWKEFVTLNIRDGKIVSVEYNARNSSGFIKSWDMDYMRTMDMIVGNYPNRYTRDYGSQLVETQDISQVDALAGATTSHSSFQQLVQAALDNAAKGDTTVAVVNIKQPS